jgi:hypothetical protein
MGITRIHIYLMQILFIAGIVSLFSAHACADTLILYEKMPKYINGENSVLLQSRIDEKYTDLVFRSNNGAYWFGTPNTYRNKPVITRGAFNNGQQYDKLAIYSWPSAEIQTGFKSDAIIRVTVPGPGGSVKVSGQGVTEGQGTASHYRFYIYKGESQYNNPLWETVGEADGGHFNFTLDYLHNDQLFFAVEALDSDDELKPKWKSVVLETYIDQASNGNQTTEPTSMPITGPTSLQQGTPSYVFPLILAVILAIACIGVFGYRKYRQKSTVLHPPTNAQSSIAESRDHHDVFISYAHVDKPVADAMCARLESQNIRCWIAPRDVSPGKNFPEAIVEGIGGSKIMVIIFSSHSNKSEHVIREVTTAINKSLIIIPFRIEDITPSKSMEYLIGTPHWLNALTPPLEKHLDTLVITIKKILSNDII